MSRLRGFVKGLALAGGTALAFSVAFGSISRAQAQDWTGPYIGAHLGADWQDADTSYTAGSGIFGPGIFVPALDDGTIPRSSSQDTEGFIGGASLGYNLRSDLLVYGIEADATWLSLSESSAATSVGGFFAPTTTVTETKTDWLATLRARAGILVSPQSLLYVTGGLAAGHVEGSTSVTPQFPSSCALGVLCSSGSGSDTLWGWTIGGGLEHAFSPGWTVKLDYLYYDLGGFSYTANEISPAAPAAAGAENLIVDTDVTGQILRAGVNFNF